MEAARCPGEEEEEEEGGAGLSEREYIGICFAFFFSIFRRCFLFAFCVLGGIYVRFLFEFLLV